MSDKRNQYYARVSKIVGNALEQQRISVFGYTHLAKAVELLASCGAFNFNLAQINDDEVVDFWQMVYNLGFTANNKQGFEISQYHLWLQSYLASHNEFEDRWQFSHDDPAYRPTIVIGAGSIMNCQRAYEEAQIKNAPLVIGIILNNGLVLASVVMPGDEFPWWELKLDIDNNKINRYCDSIDLNNQIANLAKAVMLLKTPWERKDISDLISRGKKDVLLAHPSWPWTAKYLNLKDETDLRWLESVMPKIFIKEKESLVGKNILIVGLGSLGSLLADHFRVLGANIIGIDSKDISIFNPIRQLYPTSMIGRQKAHALPMLLAQKVFMGDELPWPKPDKEVFQTGFGLQQFIGLNAYIEDDHRGQRKFEAVVKTFNPDLAILTTANPAEFRMANILRQNNIPHIIGRCYPRARWFEATYIDGQNGPCFGCLQGHLYKGAVPTLTEEQMAAYDPQAQIPEEGMLQAEPATRIDTSRCCDTILRLSIQALNDEEKRAGWFSKMILQKRPCLIGGNTAELQADGQWSFDITAPGGAALYGVINFVGSETETTKECLYCGQVNEVLIHRPTLEGGING
ncbi:MAG: hypothetical protein Q7K65_04440 [Candidatus Buchananbacteria bacterium]|nr:hypothetical protein [Candidatus Buchananbacteria bacterium]